ncbi:hypothetical protein LZ30DRAFT_683083 [Colletotrichum cereale]|nr:hypothetical protein LZ30DRAFT_683083 [Colletotrichum cereale]
MGTVARRKRRNGSDLEENKAWKGDWDGATRPQVKQCKASKSTWEAPHGTGNDDARREVQRVVQQQGIGYNSRPSPTFLLSSPYRVMAHMNGTCRPTCAARDAMGVSKTDARMGKRRRKKDGDWQTAFSRLHTSYSAGSSQYAVVASLEPGAVLVRTDNGRREKCRLELAIQTTWCEGMG